MCLLCNTLHAINIADIAVVWFMIGIPVIALASITHNMGIGEVD
jgi:hypothetical protein